MLSRFYGRSLMKLSVFSASAILPTRAFADVRVRGSLNLTDPDSESKKPLSVGRPKTSLKGTPVREWPIEVSLRYMASDSFKLSYGDNLIWTLYRRNLRKSYPFARRHPRKSCISKGVYTTGNPCPICRDEYLVVHYRNTALLKQFINPADGRLITNEKTGICQRAMKNLLVEVERAWDYGLLQMPFPHRQYNYAEWAPDVRDRNALIRELNDLGFY